MNGPTDSGAFTYEEAELQKLRRERAALIEERAALLKTSARQHEELLRLQAELAGLWRMLQHPGRIGINED